MGERLDAVKSLAVEVEKILEILSQGRTVRLEHDLSPLVFYLSAVNEKIWVIGVLPEALRVFPPMILSRSDATINLLKDLAVGWKWEVVGR